MEPRIQYAKTSDGVSIAYCDVWARASPPSRLVLTAGPSQTEDWSTRIPALPAG